MVESRNALLRIHFNLDRVGLKIDIISIKNHYHVEQSETPIIIREKNYQYVYAINAHFSSISHR